MRAILFAAGLGTRLRPLTDVLPKPVVPLCGFPLARYGLAQLARAGITEVVLNTFHYPDRVVETLGDGLGFGMTLSFSREGPEILGTAGGIRNVGKFLRAPGEPFVVMNGDTLIDVDVAAVIAQHRRTGAAATMVLRHDPRVAEFGGLGHDASGRIWDYLGRAPVPAGVGVLTKGLFTGVQVLQPDVLDVIPAGYACLSQDLYPTLLKQGRVINSFLQDRYWCDLGTPARYLETAEDILHGRATTALDVFASCAKRSGVWCAPGARVSDRAVMEGPALIGAGAVIEDGARIGPGSVIEKGARVESGARIDRSIVWPGVTVPAGAALQNVIAYATPSGFATVSATG